jgi:hypothetical protein
MDVGTILEGQSTIWLVRKIEPSLRTAIIESQDGRQTWAIGFEEISGTKDYQVTALPNPGRGPVHQGAVDVGTYHVLANPVRDWPSVTIKPIRRGRLVEVRRASLSGETPLRRFLDWVKLDEFQVGGSLYLNPDLDLAFRDRLILLYEGRLRVPADIPRDFVPTHEKQSRQPTAEPLKGPFTLFDHLVDEDS